MRSAAMLHEHAAAGASLEDVAERARRRAHRRASLHPRPAGPRPGHPDVGGAATRRVPALAERDAEFYFCDALWPDFRRVDFLRALRCVRSARASPRRVTREPGDGFAEPKRWDTVRMSGRHRRSSPPRRGRHRRPPPRGRLLVPALAATVVLGGGGAALGLAVGGTNGTSGGTVAPQVTPFAAPLVLSTAPVIDPTPSVSASPTSSATRSGSTAKPRKHPTDSFRLTITGTSSYVQVRTWNNHLLVSRDAAPRPAAGLPPARPAGHARQRRSGPAGCCRPRGTGGRAAWPGAPLPGQLSPPRTSRTVGRVAPGPASVRRTVGTDGRRPVGQCPGGPVTPTATRAAVPTTKRRKPPRRVYVLDTSVLLADPSALSRFAEHEVVLPLVVITELEAKRDHPELGWFARQSLHCLDDLRLRHGRLDAPLPANDAGGTVRVELNHSDPSVLPTGYRIGPTTTAASSPWRPTWPPRAPTSSWSARTCRCGSRPRASGCTRRSTSPSRSSRGWTGMAELDAAGDEVDALYAEETLDLAGGPRAAVPHRRRAALRAG